MINAGKSVSKRVSVFHCVSLTHVATFLLEVVKSPYQP